MSEIDKQARPSFLADFFKGAERLALEDAVAGLEDLLGPHDTVGSPRDIAKRIERIEAAVALAKARGAAA